MAGPDLYSLLGVQRSASAQEIKSTYFGRAASEHPDKLQARLAPEAFAAAVTNWQLVTNAYNTLSDDKQRARYDQEQLRARLRPHRTSSSPPPPPRVPRGADERTRLIVPFLVALRGGQLSLRDRTVNIPQGCGCLTREVSLRLPGRGGPGSPPGDLYVALEVQSHPYYRLADDGVTLLAELPMTWHEVYRRGGGPLIVPTPWGDCFWRYESGELGDGQEVEFEGYGVRTHPQDRRHHLRATIRLVAPPPDDLALQQVLQRLQEGTDVRAALRTSLGSLA